MTDNRGFVGICLGALGLFAACTGGELASTPAPDASRSGEAATCHSSQALSEALLDGLSVGTKQLALTFDDGPGSRTLELSAYLKAEGIRAAFFVNGHCFATGNPCGNPGRTAETVFKQLVADGHLIANHTEDHLDLTSTDSFPNSAQGAAALVSQLADTDAIIAPYVAEGRFLFRPPFGAWGPRAYGVLQASEMRKYVGPVRWDIGSQMSGDDDNGFAADWDCWQDVSGFGVMTTAQCAARYINEIRAVGRGIVLMHDSDQGDVANALAFEGRGNTITMVQQLVPQLKAEGYTFVRLDEVPSIAAALPRVSQPEPRPAVAGPATDAGASFSAGPSKSLPPNQAAAKDPCASASRLSSQVHSAHKRAH